MEGDEICVAEEDEGELVAEDPGSLDDDMEALRISRATASVFKHAPCN